MSLDVKGKGNVVTVNNILRLAEGLVAGSEIVYMQCTAQWLSL